MTGSPHHRFLPRRNEGLPGSWVVLFVRAVVEDTAEPDIPSPIAVMPVLPSGVSNPWALGMTVLSLLHGPRPTRLRTYASPSALPRPSQGSLPTWADSPLTGQVSHPLDD